MLISGSRALFVDLPPVLTAAARGLATTAAAPLRQRIVHPRPSFPPDDEAEPPVPSLRKQEKAYREKRIAELVDEHKAKQADARQPDTIWISVYLSLGEKKRSGLIGAGCSTYTSMTYDLATALKADNGERWKGIPYRRTPEGFRPPEGLRPYRMMVAVGGFNSAAAAKQFLKAWRHPAASPLLAAPDLPPMAAPLDRRGIPAKLGGRPTPFAGEHFFYNNAVSSLDYKFAVLQRLCIVHPFDKMPLRIALYNSLAAKTWQDALEGDWPGGPADSLPLVEGWTCPPARLASIDLHRRFPIPDGALDHLRPELRSQSQPWFGPTLEVGDQAQTRQLRGTETMVRTMLGTATKADKRKLAGQQPARRPPPRLWQPTSARERRRDVPLPAPSRVGVLGRIRREALPERRQ